MGVQTLPNYIEKYSETLESGTTWTVPAGCYYVNLTLFGGGGASGGLGIASTAGTAGGTTTFTGATSAAGGSGGSAKSVSALTSAGTVSGISGVDGLGLGAIPQASQRYTFATGTGITALSYQEARNGLDGEIIKSTVNTTPGASITYAIGAGGTGGSSAGSFPAGLDGGNGRIDIEYFI
jgi:hypothetical protein